MINSYTITTQTLATNQEVVFGVNKIKTGCTVAHSADTTEFILNKVGYYFVSFNADGASSAGDVVLQLQNNGVDVPGAVATNSSAGATDIANFSFSTIIQAPPSCCMVNNTPKLTIINTGAEAILSNANLVITKLC